MKLGNIFTNPRLWQVPPGGEGARQRGGQPPVRGQRGQSAGGDGQVTIHNIDLDIDM